MRIKIADSKGKIHKMIIGFDTHKIIIMGTGGRTLVINKPVFDDMLKHYPDFLIKLACFNMATLEQAINNNYISKTDNWFDFYIKDKSDITFYSITYKGIEELT